MPFKARRIDALDWCDSYGGVIGDPADEEAPAVKHHLLGKIAVLQAVAIGIGVVVAFVL